MKISDMGKKFLEKGFELFCPIPVIFIAPLNKNEFFPGQFDPIPFKRPFSACSRIAHATNKIAEVSKSEVQIRGKDCRSSTFISIFYDFSNSVGESPIFDLSSASSSALFYSFTSGASGRPSSL
jgi:hypothetical protein